MDFWIDGIWLDYLKPGLVVMVLAMAGALLVDLCCRVSDKHRQQANARRAFIRARLESRAPVVQPFPSNAHARIAARDLPTRDRVQSLRSKVERRRVERADRWLA